MSVFVTPQTAARLKRGNCTISDSVSLAVARQSCGAHGGGGKRRRACSASVSEALLLGSTPIVTSG